MSDLSNYKEKVSRDLAAGLISPEIANQMIHQATIIADPKGNLGANDRPLLRYGHLKTPPPPPPPPPPPSIQPAPVPAPVTNVAPSSPAVVAAPPPTPPIVSTAAETKSASNPVKQATPDIIVFDEEIDPDFLVEAFFEEFGGTELINISRYDLIDGEDVSYSPIVNLSNLRQSFNPNNIIEIRSFQENPTRYGIDLFSRGVVDPYFDDNGNLVIEINEVRSDESIEVEIASDGTINRIDL